ncbi:MAG: 6-phosphogluconolactonase [Planctomycetaceae bacterium]
MQVEILPDSESVAREAARFVAAEARAGVAARGQFVLALSGGRTPWLMLRELAKESLPWQALHIVQVDERVAPAGDVDRNLTHLRESLLSHAPFPERNLHPMLVEATDLTAAAEDYARLLGSLAGTPPVLDLVHLGLGDDGHTASLVPGDPVTNVADADVAVTGTYRGRRRMTLTFPILNRARRILWLATGADKAAMLARLIGGDSTIPAGRVDPARALLLADQAAAAQLQSPT